MGYCSCGNWVDEGDICEHCGGSGGSRVEEEEEEEDNYISIYQYNYRQAKTCSAKGDHKAAIGFYNNAFKASWKNMAKCEMLSAIAGEYEAMGDYSSAEKYWNKCYAVEQNGGMSFYLSIAKKGDFLYRIARYREAILAYKEAFKTLKSLKEGLFDSSHLKYYARITHFIIDSYEKIGKKDMGEKYHNKLKKGVKKFIRLKRGTNETKAHHISETSWQIYSEDWMVAEALILIDFAIDLHPDCPANYYNRKAIFLNDNFQYEEALKYYDKALSKDKFDKTFLNNRAQCEAECIKSKLEIAVLFKRIKTHHLDLINKALKILPKNCDKTPYLKIKGDILNQLGEPVKAKFCSARAYNDYDGIKKAKKQLKKLKPSETYINITGIGYYQGFKPFMEGTIVDLIKEPFNQHDRDAIRVEINGETVGYVANNKYTLINEVKSATDIKNTNSTQAEVQFILFKEWVIAKLI